MDVAKADLSDRLHEEFSRTTRFTKNDCTEHIELALEVIKKAIVEEGKLKISGFGVFEAKKKRARRGRNPQTGEEITISPRRILTFSPSAKLKERINSATT